MLFFWDQLYIKGYLDAYNIITFKFWYLIIVLLFLFVAIASFSLFVQLRIFRKQPRHSSCCCKVLCICSLISKYLLSISKLFWFNHLVFEVHWSRLIETRARQAHFQGLNQIV